jgi:hypothetical protein
LTTEWLLRAFAGSRKDAVSRYRRFVTEGMDAASPWIELKNQIYLGSEKFFKRMQTPIDPAQPLQEIPKRQRRPAEKPLAYLPRATLNETEPLPRPTEPAPTACKQSPSISVLAG